MADEYKIQTDIPLPPKNQGGRIYKWDEMTINSSFLIPGEPKKMYGRAKAAVISRTKSHPGESYEVRLRRKEKDGEDGARIWKVGHKLS